MGRVPGGGNKEPVPDKKLFQQAADAFIIIDNQEMRIAFRHGAVSLRRWKLRRISPSIMASSTMRKPATASGPASR